MPSASPAIASAVRRSPAAVRVLIVDDSAVARAVLTNAIGASCRFGVAGAVAHVRAALDLLKHTAVDVIVLDIELPGVDGLTALPDLLAAGAGAKVLIVSSSCGEGASSTVQALALGAADTLVKPGAGVPLGRFGELLIEKLQRLTDPGQVPAADWRPVRPQTPASQPYDIVAIGASTGGIHALSGLLRALPDGFDLPILVTQHLPASFSPYFAAQLAVLANRPCDLATDRLRIRPGRLIVAPGDAHLRCVGLTDGGVAVRLGKEAVDSGCLPSVDPMFESLAAVYGGRVLAVVLSGMGRDGAQGARRIAAAGGSVVVQDQASSVVWGMPGVIAQAGLAHAVLPPDAIGRLIASRKRPA